jgi:predicted ATPase/class 3 adenylate cyclase/tRNA A-37 threonylcarbamoyl transferase component Bud32
MASPFIGRTLGKYEIIQLIGQGGMATVYKGYQRDLDRYVAVKVLAPHPGRHEYLVQRFRQEARMIARLQHPHILSLYDYGSEDDILYLAMAYIENGALSDLIRAGGLPLPQVERFLLEVGSALDYAHRQRVVHRDIKPGNILLDGDGHALLGDFGIAKMTDSSPNLTAMGMVVGTPAYMAPEQSKDEPADHRADIYSLGVVAYEMLSGQPPYISANSLKMMMKHVNDPIPSMSRARNDLPPGLEIVMQNVLAKTPEARYQTVAEFCEAFSAALHGDATFARLRFDLNTVAPSAVETPGLAEMTPILPRAVMVLPGEPDRVGSARFYTFLFTDIEGSTQLWEREPKAMFAALAYHDAVMSQSIKAYQGKIFKTLGDGICAVFDSAANALQAALRINSLLAQASADPDTPLLPLSVRMGLYSGQAEERENDYFGTTVNRAARLTGAANGGQILLSASTRERLPPDIELRDLGIHRLRDVVEPEHIYQAVSPDFPLNLKPIHSLSPRPTNLPAQLASFVGRESEVAEISKRLRQPDSRLLTLVGAGGIGKTRLSIQVGAALHDEFEDGVFFISLASLNQTEVIIKVVAQVLNLPEDDSPLDAVKAHLQSRHMLLIFDNFEHLLDGAPLLNDLLAAAAHLKALVTSRESLFIYGERTYTVPPLDVPEAGEPLDELRHSSAAALFIQRVQAVDADFALSEANAPEVIKICRQLDGLPLALELAAARVRDLSLKDIAEQITQRLALLSKGPRDLPPRQRTMRGAIEWSFHLLSAEEQHAFAGLSVFEGMFTAEAARIVTDIPDLKVFQNKSLIQQDTGENFSMLAVLREYAAERLEEAGESAALRQKHGLYYRDWLEEAEPHLIGQNQIEWYSRMKDERYNLQAALDWFLQQHSIENAEPTENAGRMVAVLWRYWATQSLLNEGGQWLDRVLAHADQLSPQTHARVAQGAGRLAFTRSDCARATALQQISLKLFRSLNNQAGEAQVLLGLGETEYIQGHTADAEKFIAESLSIFRLLGDEAGIGRCLSIRGWILIDKRDFATAEPLLQESLSLARTHGSSEGIALALYSLAGALRAQAKFQEAEGHYRESLALYRDLNLTVGVGTILYSLGFVLQGQDNHQAAMQHFLEALTLLQPLDEPVAIAECLIGVAGAYLYLKKRRAGIQTMSAARAMLTALKAEGKIDYATQVEYDRLYAAAQPEDAEWQAAWAAGQSTPPEQIIKAIFSEAPKT